MGNPEKQYEPKVILNVPPAELQSRVPTQPSLRRIPDEPTVINRPIPVFKEKSQAANHIIAMTVGALTVVVGATIAYVKTQKSENQHSATSATPALAITPAKPPENIVPQIAAIPVETVAPIPTASASAVPSTAASEDIDLDTAPSASVAVPTPSAPIPKWTGKNKPPKFNNGIIRDVPF